MAILALFTEGLTSVTVNGLHQWDFGETLEIHDATLPPLVEVHFAFPGAREAIVRAVDSAGGVATVSIPDVCLEQTAPVMAWVYAYEKAQDATRTRGQTIRTIVLPIIGRARPAAIPDTAPDDFESRYTDALTAMNNAVASVADVSEYVNGIRDRSISVPKANLARNDTEGTPFVGYYMRIKTDWTKEADALPGPGTYLIRDNEETAFLPGVCHQAVVHWTAGKCVAVPLGIAEASLYGIDQEALHYYALEGFFDENGRFSLRRLNVSTSESSLPRPTITAEEWPFDYIKLI